MFRSDIFSIFALSAFIVTLADTNLHRYKHYAVVEDLSGFHYPNISQRQRNDIPSLSDCAKFSLLDNRSYFSFNERNSECRTYSKNLCPYDRVIAEEENLVYRELKEKPKSCEDVGCAGIYVLDLCGVPVHVKCELDINGKLWTVIQRRFDGSVNFYRGWEDYKTGFGNLSGELWLGNDNIHCLTQNTDQELRVDIVDSGSKRSYAQYSTFGIGDESTNYQLNIGSYTGDAGDALTYHHGVEFTTNDKDNDNYQHNCATALSGGGWWYKHSTVKCAKGVLNANAYGKNCLWMTLTPWSFDAKMEMKIRKK